MMCEQNGMRKMFDEEQVDINGVKKKGAEKSKVYQSLGRNEVPRWVVERFALRKQSDDWTVQCFFMLVCNALLFPTSTPMMPGSDFLFCRDLELIKAYDWCGAVVEDIKKKAAKWRISCGKSKTPNVQGCTAFLIVYYLDNLMCQDMLDDCLTTPRASFFNSQVIENILKHDKKTFKDNSVTYGCCPVSNRKHLGAKEKLCFVSLDVPRDLRLARLSFKDIPFRCSFILPDGITYKKGFVKDKDEAHRYFSLPVDEESERKDHDVDTNKSEDRKKPELSQNEVVLTNEKFLVPEMMFHPIGLGMNQAGLAECVVRAVQSCHPYLQPVLFESIILTGGSTLFPRFT